MHASGESVRANTHLQAGRTVAALKDGRVTEDDAAAALPPHLPVTTLPQPDETTCGPTCLHAIYLLDCMQETAGFPTLDVFFAP